MSGRITNTEKDRRKSKKMYENIDESLGELLNDKKFLTEYLTKLKEDDPRAFNTLLTARLPKATPVDQDLQKTLLSLKSVLLDLPEVEDISKELRKHRADAAFYKNKFEEVTQENDLLKSKLSKLRQEVKECQS